MRTFDEVVPESFELVEGRWVFAFGDGYTLELEPTYDGFDLGLYQQTSEQEYPDLLLKDKVPIIPKMGNDPVSRAVFGLRMLDSLAGLVTEDRG